MWLFAGNVRLEIVRPYARRHALSPIYTFPVLPARPYARPCARPYVRVYIYCVSSFPLCFPLKNHVLQPVCQSVIYEKVLIFLIKKALYIWCVFPNPLLLHPLSRTRAAIVWHSDRNGVGTLPFFLLFGAVCFMNTAFKKKNEKNFRFIWSIWNKVLTFAPAFKMRAALIDMLFETRAVTTVLFLCSSFRKRDDLKKEKNKKTSENIWKILNKVLTFASAFEKKSNRKTSDLWTDLHKQYK